MFRLSSYADLGGGRSPAAASCPGSELLPAARAGSLDPACPLVCGVLAGNVIGYLRAPASPRCCAGCSLGVRALYNVHVERRTADQVTFPVDHQDDDDALLHPAWSVVEAPLAPDLIVDNDRVQDVGPNRRALFEPLSVSLRITRPGQSISRATTACGGPRRQRQGSHASDPRTLGSGRRGRQDGLCPWETGRGCAGSWMRCAPTRSISSTACWTTSRLGRRKGRRRARVSNQRPGRCQKPHRDYGK